MTDKKGIFIGDSAIPKTGEWMQKSYTPKPQGSTQPKVTPNQNQNVAPPPSKND
jgi:hypothetical protein